MIEKLLEIKKWIKKKKPKFKRRNYGKKKRLSDSWRKPRGWQNKQRIQKKGKPARVEPGYGSPRIVKGLTRREGLRKVLIRNIKELGRIDKEKEGIVIASSIGLRKKIEIWKKAEELGIIIIEPTKKQLEEMLKRHEEEKKKRAEKRARKAKAREKKAKEEKEEKREEENKEKKLEEEKEKILTKKQ